MGREDIKTEKRRTEGEEADKWMEKIKRKEEGGPKV